MKTHPVRLDEDVYEALRVRAEAESRTTTRQANHVLRLALAGNLRLEPAVVEQWPQADEPAAEPSAAEKEWATGDPVEVEWEPEDVQPLMVPIRDEVEPDFKRGKK